jgi:magnesium transporter
MFRVIQAPSGSSAVEFSGADALTHCAEADLCWVDLQGFDDNDLARLQQTFGFHPLPIEDCNHPGQRPKLAEYENYLFMIMHSMSFADGAKTPGFSGLNIFLGARFVVTVHREPIGAVDQIWKRVLAEPADSSYGPDYLCYTIVDLLMDSIFPILDRLSEDLLDVENDIVGRTDGTELPRLLGLKRALVAVRRVLAAERDVLAILVRRGNPLIRERNSIYFRDCYDHLVRAYEQIDLERDLFGNAMDAYLSTTSNRLGTIMKQLTILSAIFLPPTFITSFFGQNFTALPFDSRTLFFVEVVTCISLPTIMLYWFYRSGWMKSPGVWIR